MTRIHDYVEVRAQPTVVRMDHLRDEDAAWISDNYFPTPEVANHFTVLGNLMERDHGSGVFLIGHYGSGKSHFLAYLTQRLRAGAFGKNNADVFPLSLVNYAADQSLEDILGHALALEKESPDRRVVWTAFLEKHTRGVLLILDELSEFLRSKSSVERFNEDIRFLQFLGEFSQNHPLWILAALQEQIEHTGEMEYELFRKIKDRYPIRLLLSPTHVKDLIAGRILVKKDGYEEAVSRLVRQLQAAFPENPMDYVDLAHIYPLHPATLELLEEVRDRFSQARGIVGFTIHQLGGDQARGLGPFLEREWGSLLSPDTIVDYFQDLFEAQPEFLPLAQKLFPYYRKHLARIFEREAQQHLALRVLKLLVLVHLSPARQTLSVREAAWWLLFKVSTIQPEKNLLIVRKILEVLVQEGAFVKQDDQGFALALEDDSQDQLETLLSRRMRELKDADDTLLESLAAQLPDEPANPFRLDRDRWQTHRVRWHFHEREFHVYFGGGSPVPKQGEGLQIGLPWGQPPTGNGCYRLEPQPVKMNMELRELAALIQMETSPLSAAVLEKVRERIAARHSLFAAQIRSAFRHGQLRDPQGRPQAAMGEAPLEKLNDWLTKYAHFIFRQVFPRFDQFAPAHGPLPKEAYRQFMAYCLKGDLGEEDAPEFVKLIREAYLVPMRLMMRKGRAYTVSAKLDQHELVTLLRPLLDHQPSPKRVYQHLANPVYGLVPDQVHLLLLLLLIQGEIDILKGRKSYRELYESLPNPLHYDRIVAGRALDLNQLRDLQILCEGLQIPLGKQANVLAQRRCAQQLRALGQKQRDVLGEFLNQLQDHGESGELVEKVTKHLDMWKTLEKGENEIQGIQHFLFTIGSPRRFLENHEILNALPRKLERLIKESRRFEHLLAHPALAEAADVNLRLAVEHLGTPPHLGEADALEEWLESAARIHAQFKQNYAKAHDAWWQNFQKHQVWTYQPPTLVESRHLGLLELWSTFNEKREKTRRQWCRGLTNLDFQAACLCGFDGEKVSEQKQNLHKLEAMKEEIEAAVVDFFQRPRVREKVQAWVNDGLESNARTLAYLAGSAPIPDIENLKLFDQHLAGLELYRRLDPHMVVELLCERIWEKDRLVTAFRELLASHGPRVAFRKPGQKRGDGLVAWCLETALRTATPLPKGLTLEERGTLPDLLRPDWVTPTSLEQLESLGLGAEGENLILRWLADGRIPLQGVTVTNGPVAALRAMLSAPHVSTAVALADWSSRLYREHARLNPLFGQKWLDLLDGLAQAELTPQPVSLFDVLPEIKDAQWLVIDCLGLPLWNLAATHLEDWFPHWQWEQTRFALVSPQTDTDSFYRELTESGTSQAFEKWNVLDRLIHDFHGDFRDLEKLAAAELGIAARQTRNLDPGKPLLLFADHGFRLERNGRGYGHGGASTLERTVPLVRLKPYR